MPGEPLDFQARPGGLAVVTNAKGRALKPSVTGLVSSGARTPEPVATGGESAIGYVAVPTCDMDRVRELLPDTIALCSVDNPAGEDAVAGSASLPMNTPFLGFVACSGTGTDFIVGGGSILAQRFGHAYGKPLLLNGKGDHAPEVAAWVNDAMAAFARSALRDASSQRLALSVLRGDYLAMENSFRELEEYVRTQHIPKLWTAFEMLPGIGWVGTNERFSGEMLIEQALPISVQGIAAIELHVAQKQEHWEGSIEVAVHAGDSDDSVIAWSASFADLQEGWNLLQAEKCPSVANVSARLSIRMIVRAGSPLALSTGEMLSPLKFRPKCAECPWPLNALAIRVWKGIAGTLVPDFRSAISQRGAVFTSASLLSPATMRKAELIALPSLDKGAKVNFWDNQCSVLVHPNSAAPTYGRITVADVPKAATVRAVVHLANEKCNGVDFAIAAIPSGTFDASDAERILKRWTPVQPLGWAELYVEADNPLPSPMDIVLATRMTRNEKPDNAWAMFRRIEILEGTSAQPVQILEGTTAQPVQILAQDEAAE